MSETALTPPNETPTTTHESLFLDGDAPRLGSTPLAAPAPMGGAGTAVVNDTPAAPMHTGDVFSDMPTPVIPAAAAPAIPAPELPTLPAAAPAVPTSAAPQPDDTADAPTTDAACADHPMAHLMGGKAQVSQASQRAAELRAAKKAKAKKMKIGFAIGALVVSAVVGPPLWSWFTNALNETGTTSTEEPAD